MQGRRMDLLGTRDTHPTQLVLEVEGRRPGERDRQDTLRGNARFQPASDSTHHRERLTSAWTRQDVIDGGIRSSDVEMWPRESLSPVTRTRWIDEGHQF